MDDALHTDLTHSMCRQWQLKAGCLVLKICSASGLCAVVWFGHPCKHHAVLQKYKQLVSEGKFQETLLEMYRWGKQNGWDPAATKKAAAVSQSMQP